MNPDRLNTAWYKVDNNLLPRAKENSKHLWIGTRWSLTDCIARRIDILTNENKYENYRWKVINVPALDENDESNFDYEMGVGFSTEFYHQRRASFERNNDLASWDAQYMGSPIEREGTVFSPDDLRYYNGTLPEVEPDRIFMAVDPAWGGGDFVASPICYQYGDEIYVDDVVYDDGDKSVTQPLVAYKIMEHKVQAVMIEGTRTTSSYAEGVNDRLKEKNYRVNMQNTTKHYTGNGKQQRIFDKAPDIREHFIFRENGCRGKEYEQFMLNVFAFKVIGNNKHTHDDAPDSLAMACNMAFFNNAQVLLGKRVF